MSDMERRSNDKNDRRVAERGDDRRRGPDALRTNPEVMERNDPEVMERNDLEAARSNPEVMGRSEPQTITAPASHNDLSSEMSDIRLKFDQLQSEFIDDPKGAVTKAEKLMDDMFNKMRERIQNTRRDLDKHDDTEHLRLAMRSYRDMVDSFAGRRTV
jgi:hypothetical protein